jgi:UDP-N-acetylmuramate: L-alanyl-gamma-D-glutamyl-meso-diaminopimelate ligase
MAGVAVLAKEQGHKVTGSDRNVYPPMSTQLEDCGIELLHDYELEHLDLKPDLVVVGNVVTRGNPVIETVLDDNIPFISGPQWLAENVLQDRHVIAVAGTHGKTITSSMIAWIMEYAGLNPGFLIGGVPENFGVSARLGKSKFFVIEADEYDSAFFDKRSKFVHYHPKTLVLNNLEFDHADIFNNLEDIKRQFHHVVRIVARNGLIISDAADLNLQQVLDMGCWTPIEKFNDEAELHACNVTNGGNNFDVYFKNKKLGHISWNLLGQHNVSNALAAIAAVDNVGISIEKVSAAFGEFKNVKRRMELKKCVDGITVYDDFAHHPTAIKTTITGLRDKIGSARIIVILELGSYTMRTGCHKDVLMDSLQGADLVLLKRPPKQKWDVDSMVVDSSSWVHLYDDTDTIVKELKRIAQKGDHVIVMSNSGFDNIHEKLLN